MYNLYVIAILCAGALLGVAAFVAAAAWSVFASLDLVVYEAHRTALRKTTEALFFLSAASCLLACLLGLVIFVLGVLVG